MRLVVGLRMDPDANLHTPKFDLAKAALQGFLKTHSGIFKGPFRQGVESFDDLMVVEIDDALLSELEAQDFVDRDPIPGNHKDITVLSDNERLVIFPPCYDKI